MNKKDFEDLFQRYTAAITATDVDGIVGLYAPSASIQIPVGGPLREGIDAIDAFYRENELAESAEVVGPVCVAGREAAVPMLVKVRRDGVLMEVDVIDVAKVDEQGRLLSMRAFFDLEGGRVLDGA
jgi:steroid delta-isomerase